MEDIQISNICIFKSVLRSCHTESPSYCSPSTSTVTDVPQDEGFLYDKTAIPSDTIKGTHCSIVCVSWCAPKLVVTACFYIITYFSISANSKFSLCPKIMLRRDAQSHDRILQIQGKITSPLSKFARRPM